MQILTTAAAMSVSGRRAASSESPANPRDHPRPSRSRLQLNHASAGADADPGMAAGSGHRRWEELTSVSRKGRAEAEECRCPLHRLASASHCGVSSTGRRCHRASGPSLLPATHPLTRRPPTPATELHPRPRETESLAAADWKAGGAVRLRPRAARALPSGGQTPPGALR